MKSERALRVGETRLSGPEHWQGETTWFIPGMAARKHSPGLPEGLPLDELSVEEVKAAIILGVIDINYIDTKIAQSASEITHKRASKAARKLLEKVVLFHGVDGYPNN